MIEERNALIHALLENDFLQKGRDAALQAVRKSNLKAHGKEIPFSYIPLCVNQKDLDFFQTEIKMVNGILSKMTQQYLENPDYRKVFGFSSELESLICLPCNYAEIIPIGRYDIFLDETTREYSFCEFNTDGTGGMSRDFTISKAILESVPLHILENIPKDSDSETRLTFTHGTTIDQMTEAFLRIYRSSTGAVPNPNFCITDFREEIVWSDAEGFLNSFSEKGISARFTDIRDLRFDGKHLYDATDGTIIHGIYRRAVTSLVLDHLDECSGLIEAVKAGKVTLIGHFRTSLAHSKVIMAAMHDPETHHFLTKEEVAYLKKHIPFTFRYTSSAQNDFMRKRLEDNPEEWVIKPENDFGSHGVFCGTDFDDHVWNRILQETIDQGYVAQRFCKRYAVPVFGPTDTVIHSAPLMLGIYQTAGQVAGFYSRAGQAGLIDFDHGGLCVSTVFCIEKGVNV